MKAVVIETFGGPETLKIKEMPLPIPQENEVLIKVAYAGVNPVDWKIREGYFKDFRPHEFPIILGWDVAGVVEQVGSQVTALKIGDAIFAYARKPLIKWGTYAEYVTFDAAHVAKKPPNISFAEASAIPLAGLTAWQSLFDSAQLKAGETVLILGGSGGVGSLAVQFAKQAGALVIATASPQKHPYVKKMGADLVIDHKEATPEKLKELNHAHIDVVFDCVGKEMFRKGISCLTKGGRIVSILEKLDEEESKKLGITASFVFVTPNGEQLTQIAKLIENKKVTPPHIQEMPLENVAQAQEDLRKGLIHGKVVLKVS